ncbi:MAG: 2-oxoglutarate dehydrogenase E1 component [bacterium]
MTKSADPAFLHGGNLAYLESLYRETAQARGDAAGNGEWERIFGALPDADGAARGDASSAWFEHSIHKQAQVSRMISAYRSLGHLYAQIDPIGVMTRADAGAIDIESFGLEPSDLDTEFDVGDLGCGGRMPLRRLVEYLRAVYCGPIGYEIEHLTSLRQREWLRARIETEPVRPRLAPAERIALLHKLTAADGLEKYLHTKYVGQKRFSLEGGDALVPILADLIQRFGAQSVREVIIGMAHRGRLNVLVNILGKAPKELFDEFEGKYEFADGDNQTGDVKYHQGVSSDIDTPGGIVHVALAFNPSHLEIIDPVVEGSARARQERRGDHARKQVVPILIHGDAAFAGQGVVMETLNMSRTRGYSVGGTIHVIINNQIGFTTNTLDARSTQYCTEVAKMVLAPTFHVNGDDPEATQQAARLAMDYRMEFGNDAILDIVCYRRHGHNEADEPSVTQPMMYKSIKAHKTPRQIYAERLIDDGVIDAAQVQGAVDTYRDQLDHGQVVAGQVIDPNKALMIVDWSPYLGNDWDDGTDTSVDAAELPRLARKLTAVPDDFVVHPRVRKVLDERVAMASGDKLMDWGCAEILAYASILADGYDVRLSGQDAGRGTFSHRHVTLHDQSRARTHIPLQHLGDGDGDEHGKYLVINSLLSEEAVLAFEYGYATTEPRTLVIWEGQFGDFVNGAQVVIDQFISSGQAKWARVCGLTLFLPHGMEGQGPEHSSARLERFLQLCAEQNMQVCVPTTPAQMFHMLRRQIIRPLRRPLVVMTPKSLLRHKLATSTPQDLSAGKFHTVINETDATDAIAPQSVKRVVLCAGKVYYDLLEARRERGIADIALVRIEQLHPFPTRDLAAEMEKYPHATEVVWCQEEPKNQGAWYQIDHYLQARLSAQQTLRYVGREASPSPAVGYYKLHLQQQQELVDQALAPTS